ncbi:hypothetical protein MLD38_031078 [Melastoma candidum]|uniref:Uncharacterized protein n=1 Tax=Melastoma candidum TaxID=119954 RepID=A0ACB9MNF7_9MYRT|nr:hypothetical protein MLD38_031078 [Melastoma candidum]
MLAESNNSSQVNWMSSSSSCPLQIKSVTGDQVFENYYPEGTVCYKSESGEMICEGYDEGPKVSCRCRHPYPFNGLSTSPFQGC